MTETETETPAHPAACPHCGGTIVNQAWADMMLAPARLNPDGSITVGDHDQHADFSGLNILFCHTCGSDYVQPASVVETFNDSCCDEITIRTPSKGEPGYIGADVIWLPLTPEQVSMITSALDTHEYWELGDRLPRNNGCVFIPDDEGADRYWDDDEEPDDDQEEAIEAIKRARAIADFLTDETGRQLNNEPNHNRPED